MNRWLYGWALLGVGMTSPVAAQENGDPVAGLELAEQLCTGCHIVGTEAVGSDIAPPFPVIAHDPELTLTRLHAWPGAPHPVIPDLALGDAQIADINAYLESLREITDEAPAEPIGDEATEEEIEDAVEDVIEEPAEVPTDEPARPEGAAPRVEDEEPPPAIIEAPPEEIGPPIEPSPPAAPQ